LIVLWKYANIFILSLLCSHLLLSWVCNTARPWDRQGEKEDRTLQHHSAPYSLLNETKVLFGKFLLRGRKCYPSWYRSIWDRNTDGEPIGCSVAGGWTNRVMLGDNLWVPDILVHLVNGGTDCLYLGLSFRECLCSKLPHKLPMKQRTDLLTV
jgi:hypothetical protein